MISTPKHRRLILFTSTRRLFRHASTGAGTLPGAPRQTSRQTGARLGLRISSEEGLRPYAGDWRVPAAASLYRRFLARPVANLAQVTEKRVHAGLSSASTAQALRDDG